MEIIVWLLVCWFIITIAVIIMWTWLSVKQKKEKDEKATEKNRDRG